MFIETQINYRITNKMIKFGLNQFNPIMKIKSIILMFIFFSSTLNAQSRGEKAAAGAGAALAVGAIAFQIHQLIEMWELTATEYVLDTRPDATEFTLKLNKPFANSTKWSDVSNVSILTFNIGYSKFKDDEECEKEVLMMFLDPGYMTQYGIDLTLVSWRYLSKDDWNSLLKVYLKNAVGFDVINNDRAFIYKLIKSQANIYDVVDTVITNSGDTLRYGRTTKYVPLDKTQIGTKWLYYGKPGEVGNRIDIVPLQQLGGDSYLRAPFNDDMDVLYNERSMGLYLKDTRRLIQLNKSVVNSIHDFLN